MKVDKPWTAEEIALFADHQDIEIGFLTGRTTESVRAKRGRLATVEGGPRGARGGPGNSGGPMSLEQATYEVDKEMAANAFWEEQYKKLEQKYARAIKDQGAVDQLVGLAAGLAPMSYAPAPPIVNTKVGKGRAQSAVLVLSDTHVGQVVEADQTLGFGHYNFDIFLARLKHYEEAVKSIMLDHTATEISELVVCLGGDMLHGNLQHGGEAAQTTTLLSQFYGAGHALTQFLRNLSALVKQTRVYCTVGNHTRWGTQKRMPTENRYSNLDSFLYVYMQALTRDLNSIQWNIDKQPVSLFDVQGFLFHLSHGDTLRGGDRALGIPNHAVGRMVSSNSQLFGKKELPSPNYYLVGHLHRSIVLPHGRGSVIVNGGFPGVDGYGLAAGFTPVDPTQVFFLVHPVYGKTATYDIELKFAKEWDERPYSIPDVFEVA